LFTVRQKEGGQEKKLEFLSEEKKGGKNPRREIKGGVGGRKRGGCLKGGRKKEGESGYIHAFFSAAGKRTR